MAAKARQAGIQRIQNNFRENAHRLYHWAKDRTIPPENNLAERALRPLVIAPPRAPDHPRSRLRRRVRLGMVSR
ncbi:MAG: transposase [Kiritimatiellia bacterium]